MLPDITHKLNNLGQLLYGLFADTLISMREHQLGIVKIADNTIRLLEYKDADPLRWATCFMTMRIPHGEQMNKFLNEIMPKFSLVSIQEQFCLLQYRNSVSSSDAGDSLAFKTISLY